MNKVTTNLDKRILWSWVKVDQTEEAYTFHALPYGDYAMFIFH